MTQGNEPSRREVDAVVVVIGLNAAGTLRDCLRSVMASSVTPRQVVYADAGSTDESLEIARGFPRVEVVESPDRRLYPGAARNAGLAHVSACYVQFVDCDMTLDSEWLATAVREMNAHPAFTCICGRTIEASRDRSLMNSAISLSWEARAPGACDSPSGGGFFRADELKAIAGYNGTLIAAEETELGDRIRRSGGRIEQLATVMCTHDLGSVTAASWARRALRTGRAHCQVAAVGRQWRTIRYLRAETDVLVYVLLCFALWRTRVNRFPGVILAALPAIALIRFAFRERQRGCSLALAMTSAICNYAAMPLVSLGFAIELELRAVAKLRHDSDSIGMIEIASHDRSGGPMPHTR